MNNPLVFLQDIIRRGARLVGWEIGEAIEGVMWTSASVIWFYTARWLFKYRSITSAKTAPNAVE